MNINQHFEGNDAVKAYHQLAKFVHPTWKPNLLLDLVVGGELKKLTYTLHESNGGVVGRTMVLRFKSSLHGDFYIRLIAGEEDNVMSDLIVRHETGKVVILFPEWYMDDIIDGEELVTPAPFDELVKAIRKIKDSQ